MATVNENGGNMLKATVRAMKKNDETFVNVLSDPNPSSPMFAVFEVGAKTIPVYRKGQPYVDGRTIGDITSIGAVLLGADNSVAFLKYKDLINLSAPVTLETKQEVAETVAPHGKGANKK